MNRAAAAALLLWCGGVAMPSARAQTVVLTARSVGELADDLSDLVMKVAPPGDERVAMVNGVIEQLKKGELVKGLDNGRLVGVAASLPGNLGEPPSLLAAIPVTDFGLFMDSLQGFGLAVEDAGMPGFSRKVSAGDGNQKQTFFALEANRYAIFSLVPTGAEKLKALDPSSWRPKSVADSDLALALQLSKIPAQTKDQFIQAFEAQAAADEAQKPGESDAEYKGRMAANRIGKDAVKSLIRDGDTVILGLNLDRAKGEVSLELAVSAMPETAMAKALGGFGQRTASFSFLSSDDAAVAGWLSLPRPAELKQALNDSIEEAFKKQLASLKTDEERKRDTSAYEKFKKLLEADDVDVGLAIRTPRPGGPATGKVLLLSGMKLKNVDIEKVFREIMADAQLTKGAKMEFDVAKAADGTAIHRLTTPKEGASPDSLKSFGNAPLLLAFPGGAMLLTYGEGGMDALKEAIANFKRGPGGASVPVAAELHLAPLVHFSEQNPEELRRAAEETFKAPNNGRDAVRLVLKGADRSIRVRLGVDYAAFSFLAKLGTVTQSAVKGPLQIRVPAPN